MSEKKTILSYTKPILILIGVCLLAWGLYHYVPISLDDERQTNNYSFKTGVVASARSSECKASSSTASIDDNSMLATPISTPGWITVDIKEMAIDMTKNEYQNKAFPITVCAGWPDGIQQVQVSFNSSGVVSFSDNLSTTTVSENSYQDSGSVTISATGTGELAVNTRFEAGTNSNHFGSGKSLTVFVLAKENRLYIGQSSLIALRIKHLKWLRDTGKINQSEYERRMKDLATTEL